VEEENPDAVLLCETDGWWIKELGSIEDNYPYTIKCPLSNHYGMALYSRLPFKDYRIDYLIQDDVPSFLVIIILPSGDEIELHCVHPRPPVPEETARSTERDGELLLIGKSLRDSKLPVIVAGDLNDVAWSRTTKLFQKGRGFYNSFHAKYRLIRFPLDHVFHSRHFRLISLKRLEAGGSDHFPIFVSLSYEPDAKREQEKPKATIEEKQEAAEKIEKAIEEND
jgi:endonuclease/exonuclease/phosphatase (EEP) superfamily protein YafD